MKKIISITPILLFMALLFISCKKNEIKYVDTEPVEDKALLKFNYVSGYAANPVVQLSINNARVSNVITSRTPFPGGGYNTGGGSQPDYLAVNPGNLDIAVSIPKAGTNIDSVVLYKTSVTVERGKNYTAHITDTAANTKTVLTTDDFSMPNEGSARFKFVNLMPNVTAVDLFFGTTLVAGNIPYLGTSAYFVVNVPLSATAWTVKETGTGTTLATYSSSNTYLNRRVYTAFALGYKNLTDNPRKPYISFLLNR